jgi:hypothetical protein
MIDHLRAIWDWFGAASNLANFYSIVIPTVTVASAVRWFFHRRLATKEWTIRHQKEQLEKRTLAETALAEAAREWSDGNTDKADRILSDWIHRYGGPISELLKRRADLAVGYAGEFRADYLAGAEAYAVAAIVFSRENEDAVALLG